MDGTIAGEPGRGGLTAVFGDVRFRPLTEGLWLRTLRGRRRRYRDATGAKLCTNFRACVVSGQSEGHFTNPTESLAIFLRGGGKRGCPGTPRRRRA